MGVKEMRALPGWHNDGDFFVHFLDSPEQGLLVIPLWSDVVERGGGTVICCDGIAHIARHLVSFWYFFFFIISGSWQKGRRLMVIV